MYIGHPNICKNMATSAMLLYPNLIKPPLLYKYLSSCMHHVSCDNGSTFLKVTAPGQVQ